MNTSLRAFFVMLIIAIIITFPSCKQEADTQIEKTIIEKAPFSSPQPDIKSISLPIDIPLKPKPKKVYEITNFINNSDEFIIMEVREIGAAKQLVFADSIGISALKYVNRANTFKLAPRGQFAIIADFNYNPTDTGRYYVRAIDSNNNAKIQCLRIAITDETAQMINN